MTADELAERLRAQGHLVTLAMNTDVAGAAAALGVSTRTLERWRRLGELPEHITIRGRVWYPIGSLIAYLHACA